MMRGLSAMSLQSRPGRRLIVIPRRNPWVGLGSMVHGVELEDCGQYTTVPSQYACSVRNQDAINASYDEHPGSYLGDGVYAGTPQAVAIYGPGGANSYTTPGSVYYNQPPPSTAPPPTVYHPTLTFTTSRGSGSGQTLQPGDAWKITISGARPGASVAVYGGQDGANFSNTMGTIDTAGNWQATGSIDATQKGSWSEDWRVDGSSIGSFTFAVAVPSAPPPATTPPPRTGGPDPNPNTPPPSDGGGGSLSFLTGSAFLGIPNWALLAGVGGLVFLGGRR
jgi:hypothetical protein